MLLLACTDLHHSHAALNQIKKKARRVDAIACAGDISIFENGLTEMLAGFNALNLPVILIPGNHETPDSIAEHSAAHERIFPIHSTALSMDAIVFLGHGGGGFSERSGSFTRVAQQFAQEIARHDRSVLIVHQPPFGTKLDAVYGNSAGNKDYRLFIEQHKPDLVICGHIHENAGKSDHIGTSLIINPGPEGMIIDTTTMRILP